MREKLFYRGFSAILLPVLLLLLCAVAAVSRAQTQPAQDSAAAAVATDAPAATQSAAFRDAEMAIDPLEAAAFFSDAANHKVTPPAAHPVLPASGTVVYSSRAAGAGAAHGAASGAAASVSTGNIETDLSTDVARITDTPENVGDDLAFDLRNTIAQEDIEQYLPESMTEVLRKEIFGISILQFTYSFVVLLVVLLLRNIVVRVVFVYLEKLISRSRFSLDTQLFGALQKPASVFLLYLGIYMALIILPLSHGTVNLINNLYRGITVIIVVWGIVRAIDAMIDTLIARDHARFSGFQGFVPLIRKTLKIFVCIVGVVMAIDNMGFNIGGILATLGIGGAAIAFASKDTVANGFGTLMIMLDRPFKVGDWIMVGDKVDGDVEEIGLRSTKVRTWPKTIISIPNGVLANEYINNWSRMPKRRVRQVLQIAYGATANDMEAMVEDIRQILRGDDGVDQDFMLVNFIDLSSESLDVLVYYFTKSIKWLEHMDVRQRINLKMMRAVEERGLKMAFLEQSVELEYNKENSVNVETEVPWESRWNTETDKNPAGTYTARKNAATGKNGQGSSAKNLSDLKLPGDFGPDKPL